MVNLSSKRTGVHAMCMLCACYVHAMCMLCACYVHAIFPNPWTYEGRERK